jgi:hypothetical protein
LKLISAVSAAMGVGGKRGRGVSARLLSRSKPG